MSQPPETAAAAQGAAAPHRDHAAEAVPFRVRLADGPDGPVNRLVVYDWFTRVGTPPRQGNRAEVLVDGEESWGRVAADLATAREELQVAMWLCRPDSELTRPEALALAPPAERADRRFAVAVEQLARAGVQVRLLVWGAAYTPIVNRWLRRWYWRPKDRIEVVEQDHPRFTGSYHQKTLTIDRRVGYCSGMNLKENDWDCCAHDVFEVRRHPWSADGDRRRAVAARWVRPPFPPRHDLMVRLEGPAVADLAENFRARWNESLAWRRAHWYTRAWDRLRRWIGHPPSRALPPPPATPPAGDRWVQVVRTTPKGEEGILDTYRRAIRNARRYIYIENQYFRGELIGRELARAVAKNPRLRLAVVVKPINDGKVSWLDPSGYWTAFAQDAVREVRPDFHLTELVSFGRDSAGRPVRTSVDVHAKVMVIDDVWVTIGSANINDRGFRTEAEINTVLVDDRDARALRLRLMAEHLRVPAAEAEARLGDIDAAFDLWGEHARTNAERRRAGEEPVSNVHAFVQRARSRPPFGVGPGLF